MRKVEFVNYHYLVLALIHTINDSKILYEILNYIFENYHFSINFCNDLYKFVRERINDGDQIQN